MSMCEASETGLPVSIISARRNSSKRWLMRSATLYSSSERLAGGIFPHSPSSARLAAITAASTSSRPAS
jgi:hypothetical protein